MAVDVLLGLQWGDEGKGKLVDWWSRRGYDFVARFQGGPNAGHTIYHEGRKMVLHHVPAGIFAPGVRCVIGSGVAIDPVTLVKEIESLREAGVETEQRLIISSRAHLILPVHRKMDQANEKSQNIGSTLRGVGPAYRDRVARCGLTVGETLWDDFTHRVRRLADEHRAWGSSDVEWDRFVEAARALSRHEIADVEILLSDALDAGANVLAEGAQGALLDLDFGQYPYVTSCHTTAGAVCTGLGVAPRRIRRVIGVFKAYATRVGNGPFPTEIFDQEGERLRAAGNEYGATTGRPRRCGWLDLPALRYAVRLNGADVLCMTKPDVLACFATVRVCVAYTDRDGNEHRVLPSFPERRGLVPRYVELPGWNHVRLEDPGFKRFLDLVESELQMSVEYVSSGPGRDEVWRVVA
ncbi:MAG: adenylosuccinate synthase [Bacteroidia bacterium]|nr:adenylosuccinate synthase [Bacteroidia bacterium]